MRSSKKAKQNIKPGELTDEMIAVAMGLEIDLIYKLARNSALLYLPPEPTRIKGKIRNLEKVRRFYRLPLRKLHRYLQKLFPPPDCVHGGAKGSSCISGANLHLGKKLVCCRDIKDCFPSTNPDEIRKSLLRRGFRPNVAWILTRLLTVNGHIPQGSPVSSDALNLLLYHSDLRLQRLAADKSISIERTYDDIVFSGEDESKLNEMSDAVENEIESLGYKVNKEKKKEVGCQPASRVQRVHNMIVNSGRGLKANEELQAKALRLAESFAKGCKRASHETIESLADKRQRLLGYICHFSQMTFTNTKHLRRLMGHGDCHIAQVLEKKGLQAYKKKWWLKSTTRNEPKRLSQQWKRQAV